MKSDTHQAFEPVCVSVGLVTEESATEKELQQQLSGLKPPNSATSFLNRKNTDWQVFLADANEEETSPL